MLFFFFPLPACLWLQAFSCGNSRWEVVHLWQWRIWSSGSKVNIQQDAAWEGGCLRGIPCRTGEKWERDYFYSSVRASSVKSKKVKLKRRSFCSQVSCGLNHTLVLSQDGMIVWAFGDGDYGKLGTGSSTAKYYPQVRQWWWSATLQSFLWRKNIIKDRQSMIGYGSGEILGFVVPNFRKWSNFATRELRRSAVGLSSLWRWPMMDMFTHLDKVHFYVKIDHK